MLKRRMMTPGPTIIPPEVVAAMAGPFDHHRTASHRKLFARVRDDLQYVFQTRQTCLVVTGSGTAAMEAALVSTCRPDGKTLVICGGKFSERWARVCDVFGFPHVAHQLEWGTGARAEDVTRCLDEDPTIDTVVITHSETTTAAVSDLQAIAAVTRERENVLTIVDGITSVGAIPVRMDDWGVDIVVTGSQKALMTPPGLGCVAVSERAWKRIESLSPPALYLDLKAYRKALDGNDTPYTPAITLMMGLARALEMIREEGIENVWARTARLARATRAAVVAMELKVLAKDPVDSLTAIAFPDGFDVAAFQQGLRDPYGILVAGGQAHLKGRIIRVNHMGYVDEVDTMGMITAMELLLRKMGHPVRLGAGTSAALEILGQ